MIPDKSIFRCCRCGTGGNTTNFVALIENISSKSAYEKIKEMDFSSSTAKYSKILISSIKRPSTPIASPETRDKVYRAMLNDLSLNDKHIADLKRRGLSDEEISNSLYRSIPAKTTRLPYRLISAGYRLIGIPGFYLENNTWKMVTNKKGYLVPFINTDGLITSLQIRLDDVTDGQKYKAFSSTGFYKGTKAKFDAHLTNISENIPKTIYLTEGSLKADIATILIKKMYNKDVSFLAIPGVSNTKPLVSALEFLKKKGVKRVVDCFDMDKTQGMDENVKINLNVEKSVKKIEDICKNDLGLEFQTMTWDKGKGIDDYLARAMSSQAQ